MKDLCDRPNIVLFLFDSLGTDVYNSLADKLPSIEATRKRGAWFSKAYCGCPESAPARASLFTGLDMAAHGVWTDGVTLPAHETIIPERFTQSGYQSWLVGRRQLAGAANWTTEHVRAGEYSHVDWAHGPLHQSRQNEYLAWLKKKAGSVFANIYPAQPNPDDTQVPTWQRNAMADITDELSFNNWIGSNMAEHIVHRSFDQPFFAVAGFVVGDSMGAEPVENRLVENTNHRALQQADTAIGSVLQALESEGLTDNTVVVIASTRGSGGDLNDNEALHEQVIKVPLIITMPGLEAKRIDSAVSTMDLAPTLYQLGKVVEPTRIQGSSLLTSAPRQWSLSRLRNNKHPHQTALCADRFKLIVVHGQGNKKNLPSYRLYDLQQDPSQLNNLAESETHQEQLEAMLDQLIDARVALEDRTEPRIAKF